MCIIAYCKNKSLRDKELQACIETNEDGTGFAYWNNSWNITKGYFEKDEIIAKYNEIKQYFPHVLHSRIATHGIISKENCHPFPCSGENVCFELNTKRDWLFHNGIWLHEKTEKCDSHLLANLLSIHNHTLLKSFEDSNRFLYIKHNERYPILYGTWIKDYKIMFSNSSYISFDYMKQIDWENHYYKNHSISSTYKELDYCDKCGTVVDEYNSVYTSQTQRLCNDCYFEREGIGND